MQVKGPLQPRDVPSAPLRNESSPLMMQSKADAKERALRGDAVVFAARKRSSKLSVLKVARKRSSKNDDEVRQEEERYAAPSSRRAAEGSSIASHPEPFPRHLWSEPDGGSFNVRGKNYLGDRVKISAGPSLFRLLTADIIEATSPLPGGSVCLHPKGRFQPALRSGNVPPFLFCVNICIPHQTPAHNYHIVAYYAVDDLSHIDGTGSCPSSKLASRFFFGNGADDDAFRDETFKFVPRIVEGNVIVKKAVGAKPVIMGRKLKQDYIRNDRFMELIIDVGSDKVADKIVKMCIGYAKTIVVDMAFILEGKDESVLPERVMGAVRLKNIDFKNQRRLVHV